MMFLTFFMVATPGKQQIQSQTASSMCNTSSTSASLSEESARAKTSSRLNSLTCTKTPQRLVKSQVKQPTLLQTNLTLKVLKKASLSLTQEVRFVKVLKTQVSMDFPEKLCSIWNVLSMELKTRNSCLMNLARLRGRLNAICTSDSGRELPVLTIWPLLLLLL